MKNKQAMTFRFSDDTISAIDSEAARTGKSKTAIIEDALLWRRQFGDEAEMALQSLAKLHRLPQRKVVEIALLKAAGSTGEFPFNLPAAA